MASRAYRRPAGTVNGHGQEPPPIRRFDRRLSHRGTPGGLADLEHHPRPCPTRAARPGGHRRPGVGQSTHRSQVRRVHIVPLVSPMGPRRRLLVWRLRPLRVRPGAGSLPKATVCRRVRRAQRTNPHRGVIAAGRARRDDRTASPGCARYVAEWLPSHRHRRGGISGRSKLDPGGHSRSRVGSRYSPPIAVAVRRRRYLAGALT